MTRRDLAVIVGLIACAHLVALLTINRLVVAPALIANARSADTQRATILAAVTNNQAKIAGIQAALVETNQLMVNSQLEANSRRLAHIARCVCPDGEGLEDETAIPWVEHE